MKILESHKPPGIDDLLQSHFEIKEWSWSKGFNTCCRKSDILSKSSLLGKNRLLPHL